MQTAQWQFRARAVPTLAALVLFAILLALGFWQLDRARQKAALHLAYLERAAAPPVDLAAAGGGRDDAGEMIWRRVRAVGRYEAAPVYLLDNQVHAGRPGYLVYSPFVLDGGTARVLVSRGWVAAAADRGLAPAVETPAGAIAIEGTAKPAPVTPVLRETPPETLAPGVLRVQRIDLAAIAAANAWTLLPYEMRLEGAEPGFVRDWPAPGSGRERHLGYAFQWFAMAAALFVIYLAVNLRRRREP
jgi:cytochrome oxidase assembly protein ShyY1